MLNLIQLNENSSVPKYLQIIDSIIHNISVGNAVLGDKVPSINKLSEEFYLSRDTVARAYNILKERNVIVSIHGKGTYVSKIKSVTKLNILFLVNKLSKHKMRIYSAFLKEINNQARVDIQCYHCDETLFLELLNKHKNAYDHYVVMPHFRNQNLGYATITEKANKALGEIPKEKLILLDNNNHELKNSFNEVYQDFENDIYVALESNKEKLFKYKKIILIYPSTAFYPYPKRILKGFTKFCGHYDFDFEIYNNVSDQTEIEDNCLYISIEEDHLVILYNKIKASTLKLGQDVGIISYNDTALKELLGITVLSADFDEMGGQAAQIILNEKSVKVKIPFYYIDRASA